ncbi:MAG: glycosyltransferase [Anaerolineales bacterium]
MKVLVVMTARTVGGAELYVQRLLNELAGECAFTVALDEHLTLAEFHRTLDPLADIITVNFDRALALPATLRRLQQLADEHDIVHLNSNHPGSRLGIACGFALGGRSTPLICVEHRATPIHDIVVPRAVTWSLPALFRWSRRGAACVVAVSAENATMLTRHYHLPPDAVRVVRSGADLSAYETFDPIARESVRAELGLPVGQQLIAVVARLSANKGHRYLIEAAPAILARHPRAHFLFVGPADEAESLHTYIAQLGLAVKFSVLGHRADVPRLLMASDVFVLPSLGEGFAVVIVEALAAGLPVVATQVGGAAEVEAITGARPELQFVPPAAPEPLARAVNAALDLDTATRANWAVTARAIAQQFSARAMAQQMLALYREILR